MAKRRSTQLARREPSAGKLRRKVIYTAGHAPVEYVVSHTLLGDHAMHWSADWLAGMFSITDLPPEWVAYVHDTWGDARAAVYAGAPVQFSTVMWDLKPLDDLPDQYVFSNVLLDTTHLRGPFGEIIDAMQNADVRVWPKRQKRLAFRERLALPGPEDSTV